MTLPHRSGDVEIPARAVVVASNNTPSGNNGATNPDYTVLGSVVRPFNDEHSDEFDFNGKAQCCSVLLVIGAIILCATIAESFHYVSYDQYALRRDVYGDVRLGSVYSEGRYFYPLNYDFITFPASYRSVKFEAVVFTDTGLEFSVDIGFYYRLPQHRIGDIYDSFSENYHDLVVSNAQTTVKNVAADFNIVHYVNNRTLVQTTLATEVNRVLHDVVMVEAPIALFRIGEVHLPETILERSLTSAIAIQNNEILANTQQVVVIRSETARLVAEINAQTDHVLRYSENEATRITESSVSYANQVRIKARGQGIALLLNTLNFTTSNYTMEIVKRLAVLDNRYNATLVSTTTSNNAFISV